MAVSARAQQRTPDPFFCNILQGIVDDANNHFIENTYRDRTYLLNARNENRFEATMLLPQFQFHKVISRGVEGLYYEAMLPDIKEGVYVYQALSDVDFHLLACLPGLVRNPIGDSLSYNYHYTDGDTTEEIFIRVWGELPSVDEDSFETPGQITIQIYGDLRRRFTMYSPDAKKKDSTLSAQFAKIEKGLLDNITTLQGEKTLDYYKQPIWKPKVPIKGATNAYLKPAPQPLLMPAIYYAEFYQGASLAEAKKVFKEWDAKIRNNAFTDKRFKEKNRHRFAWDFLPYDERFDPDDYANIIMQSAYSCPDYSMEPLNRTPLFAYHLFLFKYIDSYIVGINIGNRF